LRTRLSTCFRYELIPLLQPSLKKTTTQTFGLIFGLSDAIIGLTIFAVGNSLADLVANMSVAVCIVHGTFGFFPELSRPNHRRLLRSWDSQLALEDPCLISSLVSASQDPTSSIKQASRIPSSFPIPYSSAPLACSSFLLPHSYLFP
jgi:hypothetical protein